MQIMNPEKTCTHCHEVKPLEQFRPMHKMNDGRSSWCAVCHTAASRDWRARHPEYVAERNEARRVKNPARKCRQCGKRFFARRKDSKTCSPDCQRLRENASRRMYPR